MGTIMSRTRPLVWFVIGALLATVATLMWADAWRADASPGDSDSTFVPIAPCRLADTRPAPDRVGTAAAFGPNDTKTFAVHGTNGQCSIPTNAVAVSTNVTALGASEQTFLTFWPEGPLPLAASLNPAPAEPPTPNAVTVDLSGAGGFNVYNDAGSVDTVIDVNGYYISSSLTELAARVSSLESAQPFSVSSEGGLDNLDRPRLSATPTGYLTVTVTAPVDGQVALSATALATGDTGAIVYCGIARSTDLPTGFANLDVPGSAYAEIESAAQAYTVNPTGAFEVAAGASVDYVLACDRASGDVYLNARLLTATFTPAP